MFLKNKWLRTFLLALLGIAGLQFAVVFVSDPFQLYRKDNVFPDGYQRFLNVGLARTRDYEGAVVGTSLSENFTISSLTEILGKPYVNLTISGSTAYEQKYTAEQALANPNTREILLEVDVYALRGPNNRRNPQFDDAMFLYDDNPFNNLKYFVVWDFYKQALCKLAFKYSPDNACEKPKFTADNFDALYSWYEFHAKNFAPEKVEQNRVAVSKAFAAAADKAKYFNFYEASKLRSSFDENFQPLFAANPEVIFRLYHPPYSLGFLQVINEHHSPAIEGYLSFKEYVAEVASKHENVEIHDMQLMFDVTTDINRYKDLRHYDVKVSQEILESIRDGSFRLDSVETAKQATAEMNQRISEKNL